MSNYLQDLKFGWRVLWKNPALSLVAILSLALAIGANAAIFTVWSAVLLHSLAVNDPAGLVSLYTNDSQVSATIGNGGVVYLGVSYPNFEDFAKNTDLFSGLYIYQDDGGSLTYNGQPDPCTIEVASGNMFEVLGVNAYKGRVFTGADTERDGAGADLVLSFAYWTRKFGGDPSIIGQTITVDNRSFMVVGIAPPGFYGTQTLGGPDMWAPLSMHDALLNGPNKTYFPMRRPLIFNAVGRLHPGVTLVQARAAALLISRRLEQQFPAENRARSAILVPLLESTINPAARAQFVRAFAMMMAVVSLVLLIACANVANLLLARSMSRRREIAVRLAMGASRWRLIRQLLAESILMGAFAGLLGLLLARWLRDLLWAHRPAALLNSSLDVTLDARVILFGLALSLLAGIIFGLAPALQSTRMDLVSQLKERSEPAQGGHRPLSLRGLLLITEVTFSLIALIGAGLFLGSLKNIEKTSPGFDAAHLASLGFNLGTVGYDAGQIEQFEQRLLDRVRGLPGVAGATIASGAPMNASAFARSFVTEGETPRPGQGSRFVSVESIAPSSFFSAMGISLLNGRDIRPSDNSSSQKVAIINETMAKQTWPGQDAVNKRLKFYGDADFTEVIGVARNSKYFTLSENPLPLAYLPLRQYRAAVVGLTVRTVGPPAAILPALRQIMSQMDAHLALTNVQIAETPIQQSLWAAQMGAYLLSALALLATLLAAVGIYGVMSYGVRQRLREIGIRMAVGARPADVFRLVLADGMVLVGLGIVFGIGGALLLSRLVATFLFGVTAADPITYVGYSFVGYSLLFAAVALVASFFPARRATRIDPLTTLRPE